MVRLCVAPKCINGENSDEKPENSARFHRFPKAAAKRKEWVDAVPKRDLRVHDESVLCSLHFSPSAYQSEKTDKRASRGTNLQRKILHADAVPTIWPNCPSYLSKFPTLPRQTSLATAEAREKAGTSNVPDEQKPEIVSQDVFFSLKDIENKFREHKENIVLVVEPGKLGLLSVSLCCDSPKIRYVIKVNEDLTFDTFCCEIKQLDFSGQKMRDLKQLLSLLSKLEVRFQEMTSDENQEKTFVTSLTEKMKNSNFYTARKNFPFIVEQLELSLKSPKGRRYSCSFLAMSCVIHNISPACFRQMIQDGIIIWPSERHLRRLTNAIQVDLGVSESTKAYLKARFSRLKDKDKIVGLLIDEVHCQKKVQYSNGKFFGMENGMITKSLLCVMLKSVAGRYRDIMCMSPISNINAAKIKQVWENCLKAVMSVGFDVVHTMTDGLEANVRFFKIISDKTYFLKNPFNEASIIFLLFDTVHLFKNIYCNFLKYGIFICPSMENDDILYTAKFAHIAQLYELELTKPVKKAHKLVRKVLDPSSIEKTNVKLADACFHESTINALIFYSTRGYPEFEQTSKVLKIVREWFNKMNVKSAYSDQRTRDEIRAKINKETLQSSIEYLCRFRSWVVRWRLSGNPGLSTQTFSALQHSTEALIKMIPYLIDEKGLEYVLLGIIQSDPLEGRFRWFRQLCGADYFNSVLQFLQAEKSIRIRSLVDDGFTMADIKDIFKGSEDEILKEETERFDLFLEDLDKFNFEVEVKEEDRSSVYNYAGYVSRNLLRLHKGKCLDCVEMISPDSKSFDPESLDESYCALISRGGLCKPSNIVFITCLHAYSMWCYIRDHDDMKETLLGFSNPRTIFFESFSRKINDRETTAAIWTAKCNQGHTFRQFLKKIIVCLFNCIAVNFSNERNSEIHDMKKRKSTKVVSSNERKILKLTSGSSTAKTIDTEVNKVTDCGLCKYCKDKKKFGGSGTLKKRCVNKAKKGD